MWATRPKDDRPQIDKIGSDDEDIFNDCIGSDERDQECHDDCRDCAEPDCDSREQGTHSIASPAIQSGAKKLLCAESLVG
jgi:hypothetical protein